MRRVCPAKLNLALSVGPPSSDGDHRLASWMVPISLVDDLEVAAADGDESPRLDVAAAEDAPTAVHVDWSADADLASSAHRVLAEHAGRPLPAHVRIRKRIPAGAGLGGGSTDAAGVLRTLAALFETETTDAQLAWLARSLGSDVPFFLGDGPAVVTGTGEAVERTPAASGHLVLIPTGLFCPTGAVYRAFDAMGGAEAVDEAAIRRLATAGAPSGDDLFNDLAAAAERVEPALADARRRCRDVLGRPVHITGSGSALFSVAADEATARDDANRLRRDAGVTAVAVRTLPT